MMLRDSSERDELPELPVELGDARHDVVEPARGALAVRVEMNG